MKIDHQADENENKHKEPYPGRTVGGSGAQRYAAIQAEVGPLGVERVAFRTNAGQFVLWDYYFNVIFGHSRFVDRHRQNCVLMGARFALHSAEAFPLLR